MNQEVQDHIDAELANLSEDEFLTQALNRRDELALMAEHYYKEAVRTSQKTAMDAAAVLFMTSRILNKLVQDKMFNPIPGSDTLQ